MESEFLVWLASDNGVAVHLAVFVMLLLGGLGFPIPEDIPILLGGVASAKGIVHLPTIFLTCYVGVLLADQTVFFIGYFFGQRMLSAGTRSRFFPSITESRVEEIRNGLRKKRLFYIFVGRHLFPVRSVTFLTAGALRIPYFEFLLADAIAALVSVGIVLGIGHYLGEQLSPDVVQHLVREAHYYILAVAVLICVGIGLRTVFRKRKTSICDAGEQASEPTQPKQKGQSAIS